MCGIAGILTRDGDPAELRAAAERMTAAMTHRGPDDSGVECLLLPGGFHLALGHRRLAILDPSPRGHQPMCDPATGSWIVFNGEIYNHLDLRRELAGVSFRSHCDTETLLHGWVKFGSKWLDRLRGIFALAVYDGVRRELWLARDHVGVKPLYAANPKPGLWLFASEVRSLLASGLVDRTISAQGISSYLAFGAVQAPWTLVEGVQSVLPAEAVCFRLQEAGTELTPGRSRYWAPSFSQSDPEASEGPADNGNAGEPGPSREQLAALQAVWDESIRLQLLSDVPLGLFLSGGIDSSAIAATLVRLGLPPRTFSIVFGEGDYDESAYSRAVANSCGTQHCELRVTANDILGEFDSILAAYDQPSIDGINTYVISRAVRQAGIKVALSGLGGDEVFAGYPSFRRISQLQAWLGGLPRWARCVVGTTTAPLKGINGRWGRLAQLLGTQQSPLGWYCVLRQLYGAADRRRIMLERTASDSLLDPAVIEDLCGRAGRTDPVNAASLFELSLYMHNMLLRDADQMSMAHGLEVRVPLLDHQLVGAVARLPGYQKFARIGQPSKWLAVRLAGERFPHQSAARRKMGFVFPWDHWLRLELKPRVEEILMDRGSVAAAGLDPAAVAETWQDYLARKKGLRYSDISALVHLVAWAGRHGVSAEWAKERAIGPRKGMGGGSRKRNGRRILLVTPDVAARTGGIAMVARSLMRLLSQKASAGEIDYQAVSMRGPADPEERSLIESWNGSRYRHFHDRSLAFSAQTVWQMANWADVAIFTHLGPASLTVLLPQRFLPTTVTFLMGREAWCPLRSRQRLGLLRSDLLVTISEFTAAKARDYNPWLPSAERCHLGVPCDPEGQPDGEGLLGIQPGPKDVLIVGRMVAGEPGKGHEQLIAVMDRVVGEAPEARLIVPGCGSAAPQLRALAQSSRAAGRIIFTGFLPEPALHRLYRQCAVFAMPSRQDGFGLVYLEAMRAGKPCISSNVDGGQEVVEHGVTGFHVSPDDREELAATLVRLLKDESLCRRLGENGRRRFETMFTEEQFHERFWRLLAAHL